MAKTPKVGATLVEISGENNTGIAAEYHVGLKQRSCMIAYVTRLSIENNQLDQVPVRVNGAAGGSDAGTDVGSVLLTLLAAAMMAMAVGVVVVASVAEQKDVVRWVDSHHRFRQHLFAQHHWLHWLQQRLLPVALKFGKIG